MALTQRISGLSGRTYRAQVTNRLTWLRRSSPRIPDQIIDRYWSDFLGCEADDFGSDSTTHVMSVPCSFGFWAISRRGGWIVAAPAPLYTEALADIQTLFAPKVLPNAQKLQTLFEHYGQHTLFGPATIMVHRRPTWRFPIPPFVRPITAQDQRAVACFQAETPAIVWTLALPEIWVKVFGAFVQGRLVATCAVRVWGNLLAEIYVDTAPTFQRRGYGRAVTNAALNWIHTETSYLPESVVEFANHASIQLMKSLGFEAYAYMVTCCAAE